MRLISVHPLLLAFCCSCSTDVFITDGGAGDGGGDDASADARPDAKSDGGDASEPASIQCDPKNSMPCTPQAQVCCTTNDWTTSMCTSDSACQTASSRALACDDQTDCTNGAICCATANGTATIVITGSVCASQCNGGELQLCKHGSECKNGLSTCAPLINASPSWLSACQ